MVTSAFSGSLKSQHLSQQTHQQLLLKSWMLPDLLQHKHHKCYVPSQLVLFLPTYSDDTQDRWRWTEHRAETDLEDGGSVTGQHRRGQEQQQQQRRKHDEQRAWAWWFLHERDCPTPLIRAALLRHGWHQGWRMNNPACVRDSLCTQQPQRSTRVFALFFFCGKSRINQLNQLVTRVVWDSLRCLQAANQKKWTALFLHPVSAGHSRIILLLLRTKFPDIFNYLLPDRSHVYVTLLYTACQVQSKHAAWYNKIKTF